MNVQPSFAFAWPARCHFFLNALRGAMGEQRFHPGPANYRSWMPANGPRAEPACGSSPEHVIILIHRPPDEPRYDEEKSQDNRHSDNAEYDLHGPRDPANLLPRFIHSVRLSSRVGSTQMPFHQFKVFYRSTHKAGRYVNRLPSPRLIQELVQAWKELRQRGP
jgi:hypothetical protein